MRNVPSWSKAPLKDRIDAVIAHEYTEALAKPDDGGLSLHQQAVKLAPDTKLNITKGARRILREYRQSLGLK